MGRVNAAQGAIPTIEDIALKLRPFLDARRVLKALVFGSYARGTATSRSDLDPALVIETNRRFLERYQLVQGIESLFGGLHLEVLIHTPGELEAIAHRPFIRRMLDEGVVIHER